MKYGTTAEVLKPLDEITLPDPRIEHEPYRPEPKRPLSAADIRERLEKYSSLHSGVPERIKRQFDIARNLMLYACFVFEFQTQAELQAYAALEFALREKFGQPTKPVKRGKKKMQMPLMLAELLQKAIDKQLIQPEQLPSFDWDNQRHKLFSNNFGEKFVPIAANEWLRIVQEDITNLRNHLAHGNPHLDLPFSFNQIERCADIINALFNPTKEAGQ